MFASLGAWFGPAFDRPHCSHMPTLSPTTIVLFGVLVVFFLWLDLRQHRDGQSVRV
jgi:hypothetical protein